MRTEVRLAVTPFPLLEFPPHESGTKSCAEPDRVELLRSGGSRSGTCLQKDLLDDGQRAGRIGGTHGRDAIVSSRGYQGHERSTASDLRSSAQVAGGDSDGFGLFILLNPDQGRFNVRELSGREAGYLGTGRRCFDSLEFRVRVSVHPVEATTNLRSEFLLLVIAHDCSLFRTRGTV